jgi:hypothetical protein
VDWEFELRGFVYDTLLFVNILRHVVLETCIKKKQEFA